MLAKYSTIPGLMDQARISPALTLLKTSVKLVAVAYGSVKKFPAGSHAFAWGG